MTHQEERERLDRVLAVHFHHANDMASHRGVAIACILLGALATPTGALHASISPHHQQCCSCTTGSAAQRRGPPAIMLAKKPFKGGRLDDFLSAGEAEAKYGPGRYAAVAEDAWKLKVKEDGLNKVRERTKLMFEAQKSQQLQDHAFLSLCACSGFWFGFDFQSTVSCAVGAALGALYLYLLQRSVDGVGASTIEEVSKTPPPIIAPVVLVLLVAKNSATLSLLPALVGFVISQLATLAQIAYPDGWGLPSDDQAAA